MRMLARMAVYATYTFESNLRISVVRPGWGERSGEHNHKRTGTQTDSQLRVVRDCALAFVCVRDVCVET
jgi:hypothetical protein